MRNLFVKNYGTIATMDQSKEKDILIGCTNAIKNKKVLIGVSLTLLCGAYTLIAAFNHGSQVFQNTEDKVLTDLGLM